MSPGGRSSGSGAKAGGRPGSTTKGGGTKSGGTTKKDGGVTGDDSDCVGDTFTPGQNGTLGWNTTQAIEGRPILLYVFDGHVPSGENYSFSRMLELEFLKDKDVITAADEFVCEKACLKETDFLAAVKGREPVQGWLAANMDKLEQRKARLVVLDASGALLRTFESKELREAKPALLVRELKKALKSNLERVAANEKKAR